MALRRDLSPPGDASYDSNSLHVGDGTWDSGRNTFLLPNLMGVNFDTMRYNGKLLEVVVCRNITIHYGPAVPD